MVARCSFGELAGRGRWWSGIVWALIAASAVGVLGLSALLRPAAEGQGTHTQLGLAPCTVLVVTGYPCPTCGLTTSFAHLARLEVPEALAANLAGIPFFLVALALIPLSLVALARRMPVLDTLAALRGDLVAATLVAATLVGWILKLALVIAG